MFRTLAVLALFAAPVRADDKPKPPALTAKEIADGWILLFDGETTFGWKVEGDATVKDGALVLGGKKATTAVQLTRFMSYRLQMEATGSGSLVFASANGGSLSGGLSGKRVRANVTVIGGGFGGSSIQAQSAVTDGVTRTDITAATDGPAELRIEVPAGETLTLQSVKLLPDGQKPLFNGKDLTGWKVNGADPKRMASKWSVTKEGELAVKDGPGDLVCEKEFDNFVLQFECKTNGKALNSGIFFRCIPGQYQNGYEAQIQNAYKDGDRTKPADFGTGAIYRRVAARKVVSNDNEWFTMTVAANGKHIATWVNGYQTVDWTDDRKDDENPRKGYRAAKGPLSIQGHDPTTDILFRNIRASEFPAK